MLRKSNKVIQLAKQLMKDLKPYCKKIEIVGSIRRNEKNPKDIDFVIIPKNKEKIKEILGKRGKFLQGGEKKVYFKIQRVEVEIYFTNFKSWGATLLAYSSRRGASIGLRIIARAKGYKLNQYGLFKKGKYIAGRTEREIYKSLGRKYKEPENR